MSSGEGYPAGSAEALIAIQERQRDHRRRIEDIEERGAKVEDEISDVRRGHIKLQGKTDQLTEMVEAVVKFQEDMTNLGRKSFFALLALLVSVLGVFGVALFNLLTKGKP